MKKCRYCNKMKDLLEFSKYKSGVNKGYYKSYCNNCCIVSFGKYRRRKPWSTHMRAIQSRCNLKNGKYTEKGIRNYLVMADVEFLWFRDKAFKLKKPSIHRVDNDGDYTLYNCKFIEYSKNSSLGGMISKRS